MQTENAKRFSIFFPLIIPLIMVILDCVCEFSLLRNSGNFNLDKFIIYVEASLVNNFFPSLVSLIIATLVQQKIYQQDAVLMAGSLLKLTAWTGFCCLIYIIYFILGKINEALLVMLLVTGWLTGVFYSCLEGDIKNVGSSSSG